MKKYIEKLDFLNNIFILLSFFTFVTSWAEILDSELYAYLASMTRKGLITEMAK